jgi:hypothetical protein
MNIFDFVKERKYLFWYIKITDNLSKESIVEHVLNYGNFKDFNKMLEIMGIDNVAEIFRRKSQEKRCNYRPEIKNYFTLYFNKYVPRKLDIA